MPAFKLNVRIYSGLIIVAAGITSVGSYLQPIVEQLREKKHHVSVIVDIEESPTGLDIIDKVEDMEPHLRAHTRE